MNRVKSLSFSILDLHLLGGFQTSDLKQSQLVFYVSILNSDFFTRKNLQNASDIVIPMDSMENYDVLEIIIHSNKKKLGKLCVPLSDLVISEPKWFTFDVCLDGGDFSHATGRSMFDSDIPNSSIHEVESSFGTLQKTSIIQGQILLHSKYMMKDKNVIDFRKHKVDNT